MLNASTPVTTVFFGCLHQADDFDFIADLDFAAFDTPGADRAAALDRKHVFDAHEERLVFFALRGRDVVVEGVHQIVDTFARGIVLAVQLGRAWSTAADDRNLVAGETVLGEQFTQLQLDQVEKLWIVDGVDLVHEDDDVGHIDLAGQEQVLAASAAWARRWRPRPGWPRPSGRRR